MNRLHNYFWLIPALVILGAWEIASRGGAVNPTLFPPPSQVATALGAMTASGILLPDIAVSAWRLFAGVFVGASIGVALGLLTGRVRLLNHAFAPIIHILRPLPPVAIIPLVIVWFGIGDGAKIFSIAFAVFFPVWINTHIGAERIPQAFLWNARLLTRSSLTIFRKVVFPGALPFISTGIRGGIAVAFIMVFVSELAGASSGLGYRISITQLAYKTGEMIAAIIVLGALGALTDQLFVSSMRTVFPWLAYSST